MKLHVINSGSSRNCYLLTDSDQNTLIVEFGKGTFDEAIKVIPDVSKIRGAIYSHKHLDHFGDSDKLEKYRIPIWTANHAEQCNIPGAENYPFSFIPLAVEHDPGVDCFAYFIRSNVEGKALFFATDCYNYSRIIDALPEPLSLVMVEVNHDAHLLDTGKYPADLKERVRRSHCSVQRASLAIQRAKCTRFVLVHPSDNNLDQEAALKYFRDGFPNRSFQFAKPGLVVEF